MSQPYIPSEAISVARHISFIDPGNMAVYLANLGWKKTMEFGEKADIWSPGKRARLNRQVPTIALPRHRDLPDYPERMQDILQTIEDIEGRKKDDILRDVLVMPFDVITIEKDMFVGKGAPFGTMPLNVAIPVIIDMLSLARDIAGIEFNSSQRTDSGRPSFMAIAHLAGRDDALDIIMDPYAHRAYGMAMYNVLLKVKYDALLRVKSVLGGFASRPDRIENPIWESLLILVSNAGPGGVRFRFKWSEILPQPYLDPVKEVAFENSEKWSALLLRYNQMTDEDNSGDNHATSQSSVCRP